MFDTWGAMINHKHVYTFQPHEDHSVAEHKLLHISLIQIMVSANKSCVLVILNLDVYQFTQD